MSGPAPLAAEPPLCVDLDGTLIRGDTLRISVLAIARRAPWLLLALPLALLRGRAALKGWVAARYIPDPSRLPWRVEVVAFVKAERERGRRVVLATAAHRKVAEAVSTHLGLFEGVIATDGALNAKGVAKVVQILKSLGENNFDYIGDSPADLPVFMAARHCYLVDPSDDLRRAVTSVATVAGEFPAGPQARPAGGAA